MQTAPPVSTPPVPRLDIGLCLAGAVSGGAYTAGVVAFLVEALDAWQAARSAGDADAPLHDTVLCSVAGASSGSLTAAALTAMLASEVPVVDAQTPEPAASCHPLYQAWVNATDILDLLGTTDAALLPVASLLDARHLEGVARRALEAGATLPPARRSWLASPLRVDFALTDLRGVPYRLPTESTAHLVQAWHADAMRHAVHGLGPHAAAARRQGEKPVQFPADVEQLWSAWGHDFAEAALASAAFPLALSPRTLVRPAGELDRQHFAMPRPCTAGPGATRDPDPDWSTLDPAPAGGYRFAAIDGGVLNNSPFDLVRAALMHDGLQALPHTGAAVLVIDPTAGPRPPGPAEAGGLGLLGWVGAALSALVAQARIRPADLRLSSQPQGLSRFLLTPSARSTVPPAPANAPAAARRLAGSFWSGFGGYFSRNFRRHDYLLGRHDAQRWLAEELLLPATHPLFARWTSHQKLHHGGPAGHRLPVIPLVGRLHPVSGHAEPRPDWPYGAAEPHALRAALGTRLDVLAQSVLRRRVGRWLLYPLWRWLLRAWLIRRLLKALHKALSDHDLL
jgi:hypothetical protein